MATTKTAISLPDGLFQELERLAKELHLSRSRLLALAFEEFVERRQNQKILRELNAAYDDEQVEELDLTRRHMIRYQINQDETW
ncbi:MAG: ribbon-helix-helix protein, CopG family [Ardenticatenales bacterium]|nr:ribbon-helix-helix protein, CopG family [Ardenticatenales bacterium]